MNSSSANPPAGQYNLVGQIASYIEITQGKRSSEVGREAALKCIFDLLGATMVGVDDIGPVAIRKTAPHIFGSGKIPVWFTGKKSTVVGAAWANASAAAAKDLDDGNRYAAGHPGAAIIPAAFAVAQETGATFEDLITAIVIGYEVGVAVGAARTTYGSSGTWTPYGVVAAAAALRRTSRSQVEYALAIAGESAPNQSFAGGPSPRIPHPEGAAVKEGIPWAVVTGLTAVYMAESGHTGPRNILDSRRHYEFPEDLALGSKLHICKTYFKPYACCRHVHAPLAAMLDVIDQHNIKGTDISAMEVEIHAAGLRISNKPAPQNLVDVQYSIPYCLALVALYGEKMLVPVTGEALEHEGVHALAAKVKLSLSEELDAVYPKDILARVTITSNGKRFVSKPTPPKGEPLMSWPELEDKFKMATRLVAYEHQQSTVINAIQNIKAGDMGALMACFADLIL